MVEVLGANIPTPSFGIGTGNITILVAIFLIAITGGIVIYLVYDWKLFNRRVVLFENISGVSFQPTLKDRARLVKIGKSGEEVLFLKKRRVYRTAYGRKMGKNTYWFAVGQDGYWYNIVLGDVDAKMGMLDIEPVDRDVRYMSAALEEMIERDYNKIKFMDKYGTIIFNGFFLLIMLIGMWFLLDKMSVMSGGMQSAVETSKELMQTNKEIVNALSNLLNSGGGSGLVK